MRDELGADNALVKKVLKGKTPEARAAELIDGTRLGDAEFRRQLATGGAASIAASNDPLIVIARSIDDESRPHSNCNFIRPRLFTATLKK